jgi:hypothetical protein
MNDITEKMENLIEINKVVTNFERQINKFIQDDDRRQQEKEKCCNNYKTLIDRVKQE